MGTVGTLWIQQEYAKFETESQALRASFLAEQKARIRQEVDRVAAFIDYQRSTTETALKKHIKERVDQAWSLAQRHFTCATTKRNQPQRFKGLFGKPCARFRFSNGRGYFFIYELGGTNILLPLFPPSLKGLTSGISKTVKDSIPSAA